MISAHERAREFALGRGSNTRRSSASCKDRLSRSITGSSPQRKQREMLQCSSRPVKFGGVRYEGVKSQRSEPIPGLSFRDNVESSLRRIFCPIRRVHRTGRSGAAHDLGSVKRMVLLSSLLPLRAVRSENGWSSVCRVFTVFTRFHRTSGGRAETVDRSQYLSSR